MLISNLNSFFFRPELETLDYPEFFRVIEGFPGPSWRKWIQDLDSAGQRTLE